MSGSTNALLALETYLTWKQGSGAAANSFLRRGKNGGQPSRVTASGAGVESKSARDPQEISAVLDELATAYGWSTEMQAAAVLANWAEIVGEQIASKTQVVSLAKGILSVECQSTTWATQLRRLRVDIIAKIKKGYPESGIEDIKFTVSGIPSWRHGIRVAPGAGPRDTYK